MSLVAVVLAAGKGTRMKSRYPKVLHQVAGRPMLHYVLDAVSEAGAATTVVVAGYGYDAVRAAVGDAVEVVLQEEQRGTAHAVMQAREALSGFAWDILVVCGDTPLITGRTLAGLVSHHRAKGAAATVLTATVEDPTGYGRVIRDEDGMVARIIEQKDAAPDELAVREINTGVYCFSAAGFFDSLRKINNYNQQGEYYLTDIIAIYVADGRPVTSYSAQDPLEIIGINDRVQLAAAEKIIRRRVLERLMGSGVTIVDPDSTYVDATAQVGTDTVIHPQTFVRGRSVIGKDCSLGPCTQLVNAVLGDGVTVWHSIIVDSEVGDRATVGPFAYIRPGSRIGAGAKVGDFVEIKKSVIGDGSKVPHLSYVGDAVIGRAVNVGAGTITCNYDGEKKWVTEIEDGAFIGSNTNLVAPVKVGCGAYIGAGSTITKDVPPGALGIARSGQKNIENWVEKKKQKKKPTEG